MAKLKLAIYWAAGCGGCDVSILDTKEKVLEIGQVADIVLWPIATDHKYEEIEKMADGAIDVCLFNGGVRNSENEHLARLLRAKSKILVAFGACAHLGGIPGLVNLFTKEEVFNCVFRESQSIDNPDGVFPKPQSSVPEGELSIPEFYNTLLPLKAVVDVDYYLPGCSPAVPQVVAAIDAIVKGDLPPKGAVIGASEKTLCDECTRPKEDRKIKKFYRPHEIIFDNKQCFLDQGIICLGPATRAGCGNPPRCTVLSNMPCRGCYGPAPKVHDQGAKFLSALASVIDSNDPAEINSIVAQIADPVGTFYRFGLAASYLRRKRSNEKN